MLYTTVNIIWHTERMISLKKENLHLKNQVENMIQQIEKLKAEIKEEE